MKYIIGFILAMSLGINFCFIYNLKRYQIEIIEQKRHTAQKVMYYEYWSFTFPRMVNVPDTTLKETRYTRLLIGDLWRDTLLPEITQYVQFSHK